MPRDRCFASLLSRLIRFVVHDTERWKQELASLATASGLGVEKDESKQPNKPMPTADSQHAPRSGAHYSTRTGRFNEGASKSRGRTTSKHHTANSDLLFRVPENEREMWVSVFFDSFPIEHRYKCRNDGGRRAIEIT